MVRHESIVLDCFEDLLLLLLITVALDQLDLLHKVVGGTLDSVVVPYIQEDGGIDIDDVVHNSQQRLAWVSLTQVKPEATILNSCPPDNRNLVAN